MIWNNKEESLKLFKN